MVQNVQETLKRFNDASVRMSAAMDELVRQAVFGDKDAREVGRWLIWEIGQHAGVRAASIHELHMARGRGEGPPFTTPAMNVRVLTYYAGRAIFRAAQRHEAGAVICENAPSQVGHT